MLSLRSLRRRPFAGALLWFSWLGLIALSLSALAVLTLAPDESAWVARHPTIRYAPEQDYGPFIYQEAGQPPSGLSVDILRLIAEQLPLRFEATPARPLSVNLELAKQGEVDLLTSLRPTPERAAYLAFTSPYVSVPAAVIVRAGDDADSLQALSDRPVAVGRGYAVEGFVRNRYPQVRWQAVDSDQDGLIALRQGSVAAVVADEGSFAFLQRRHGWNDLRLGRRVGFEYPLSFAYRKDWPELGRLLERGLREIPPERRQAVLARWLPEPAQNRAWKENLGLTAFAAALIGAGALLLWKRRRARSDHDGD